MKYFLLILALSFYIHASAAEDFYEENLELFRELIESGLDEAQQEKVEKVLADIVKHVMEKCAGAPDPDCVKNAYKSKCPGSQAADKIDYKTIFNPEALVSIGSKIVKDIKEGKCDAL